MRETQKESLLELLLKGLWLKKLAAPRHTKSEAHGICDKLAPNELYAKSE